MKILKTVSVSSCTPARAVGFGACASTPRWRAHGQGHTREERILSLSALGAPAAWSLCGLTSPCPKGRAHFQFSHPRPPLSSVRRYLPVTVEIYQQVTSLHGLACAIGWPVSPQQTGCSARQNTVPGPLFSLLLLPLTSASRQALFDEGDKVTLKMPQAYPLWPRLPLSTPLKCPLLGEVEI